MNEYCCGAQGIVIHPNTKFRNYWDIFLILLIVYSSSFEPFKSAFGYKDDVSDVLDIIVDGCYWLD